MRPLQWWAESAPLPGGDRVKVFENLGAILVAPVAPVDTSLISVCTIFSLRNQGTYSLPNFSKLARADMSCQFKKRRYLCRHCLQNEWTLLGTFYKKGCFLVINWYGYGYERSRQKKIY